MIGTRTSTFVSPFRSPDLDLILKVLDVLQYPSAVGTGIYDTATSKLVLRVPSAETGDLSAIQYLSADGRSYGLWRSMSSDTSEGMTD